MSTADYTFDSSKIQIVPNVARLILPNTFSTVLENKVMNVQTFTSMSAVINQTGGDNIQFQMKVNGILQYWTGSAWSTSDGTYSQSNTVSTINTNAATLITSTNKTLQIQAAFSGSGTTTPELVQFIVNYVNGPIFTSPSGENTIYVYLRDITSMELTVADNFPTLIAVNDAPFMNNNFVIPRFYKETPFAPDSTGSLIASIPLTYTDNVNKKIRFMIRYGFDGLASRLETIRFNPVVIPTATTTDLTTIVSIDTNQILS